MIANKHRGEAKFKFEDKEYTLAYNIDTICFIEEKMQMGMMKVFRELGDVEKASLSRARFIFFAGLQEHHPDLEEKKVGKMIPAAGGLSAIVKLIREAFPEVEEGEDRPPEAGQQNGTGLPSTPSGSAEDARPPSSGN